MNTLTMNPWITALAWTLVHSIWQVMIIYGVMRLLLAMTHAASAKARYAIGVGSLAAIAICSAVTFAWQFDPASEITEVARIFVLPANSSAVHPASLDLLTRLSHWMSAHLQNVVLGWLAGVAVFGLRLTLTWWREQSLRQNLISIGESWERRLAELASDLGIRRVVTLSQSHAVSAPVLIGFLKPVILFPVGMLSGLSAEQIETILIHELAHIRRQDYLVNLLQSTMEVVYFFNPLVWMISSHVRNEREQCCDDIVVQRTNPLAYAQALHLLEESRTLLAVAAGGNKKYLLTRIKRIMEKTESNEWRGGKMLTIGVVVLALMATSWVSVRAYLPERDPDLVILTDSIPSDTTRKDLDIKKQSGSYSRKSITTYDENGQAHEQVTEEFTGDDNLKDIIKDFDPSGFGGSPWPGTSGIDSIMTQFAPDVFDPSPGNRWTDTVPGFGPGFQNMPDWEMFSKKFTDQFREHFGDFYKNNRPEFERMMKDLNRDFERAQEQWDLNFNQGEYLQQLDKSHRELEQLKQSMDAKAFQQRAEMMAEDAQRLSSQSGWQNAEVLRQQAEQMALLSNNLRELSESGLSFQKSQFDDMHRNMESFDKELTEQLITDGYLDKSSAQKNINWNGDKIEVNGQAIKEKDLDKYRALHDKYFKKWGGMTHTE